VIEVLLGLPLCGPEVVGTSGAGLADGVAVRGFTGDRGGGGPGRIGRGPFAVAEVREPPSVRDADPRPTPSTSPAPEVPTTSGPRRGRPSSTSTTCDGSRRSSTTTANAS
jgi:hypothetical protein